MVSRDLVYHSVGVGRCGMRFTVVKTHTDLSAAVKKIEMV